MIPLSDSNPTGRFPFWVVVIILINVVVFTLQILSPDPEAFITQYALIPAQVNFLDWQTIIPFFTSQFLHGGFLHIISNMLFLWIFGDNVEDRVGFLLFPFLYLLCGFAGGLAQYLVMPDSSIPNIGASGAIAGVLGAYFAWFPNHSVKTLVPFFGFFTVINIPASFMLFYWIAIQIFSGVFSIDPNMNTSGGVAYFAHIGGFLAGFILAKLMNQKLTRLEPVED